MSVERKILEEINRYKTINRYIGEQEIPADPAADLGGDLGAAPDAGGDLGLGTEPVADTPPQPVDVENDPDVEVVDEPGSEGGESPAEPASDMGADDAGTEELDITDLVTTQKDMSAKQEEYMETMMDRLNDLTSKLQDMDQILQKINDLEHKVEKYRQKSPEERLQLRSLDSYPYNQKLTDFFVDKEVEMEKTGKNEYILTPDDVENYSERDIKKSFDKPFEDEERM